MLDNKKTNFGGQNTEEEMKDLCALLGRTRTGPGRIVKQKHDKISINHVQIFIHGFIFCILNLACKQANQRARYDPMRQLHQTAAGAGLTLSHVCSECSHLFSWRPAKKDVVLLVVVVVLLLPKSWKIFLPSWHPAISRESLPIFCFSPPPEG